MSAMHFHNERTDAQTYAGDKNTTNSTMTSAYINITVSFKSGGAVHTNSTEECWVIVI